MPSETFDFDNQDNEVESGSTNRPEDLLVVFKENALKDLQEIDEIIEGRKSLSNWMFYFACQATSSVMAFILLRFTFDLMIIHLVCFAISMLPTLESFGDFNVAKDDNGWQLRFMSRPIVTIVKTLFGLTVAYISVKAVEAEIKQTYIQINEVYNEIKNYEVMQKEHLGIPPEILGLGIAAIIVFIWGLLIRRL